MKHRLAALILAAVMFHSTAAGFIFGGLPVFDGAAFAEMLVQSGHMIKEIETALKIYVKASEHYDHATRMARYLRGKYNRYRSMSHRMRGFGDVSWRGLQSRNHSGQTPAWVDAVNSGIGAVEGWERATVPIFNHQAAMANIPSSQHARKNSEVATLELQDGTAVGVIDTIGKVRLAGPQFEQALVTLEGDVFSDDPQLNTEAAQANKANVLALLQARLATEQNKLLVANTETQLMGLKLARDAAAQALISDIAFRTEGRQALADQKAGASNAMREFRLP